MATQNYDLNPPAKPSGLRFGLSVLTTIGMKEDDMIQIAAYINKSLDNYNNDIILSNIKADIANWLDKINK